MKKSKRLKINTVLFQYEGVNDEISNKVSESLLLYAFHKARLSRINQPIFYYYSVKKL